VSFDLEPLAEEVAPVPAAPVFEGVGAMGEEDAGFEVGFEDCESDCREYRYMTSPWALSVSTSTSQSSGGKMSGLALSARGAEVAGREVAAPVTRAPRAR
jgi:hypothetical protein